MRCINEHNKTAAPFFYLILFLLPVGCLLANPDLDSFNELESYSRDIAVIHQDGADHESEILQQGATCLPISISKVTPTRQRSFKLVQEITPRLFRAVKSNEANIQQSGSDNLAIATQQGEQNYSVQVQAGMGNYSNTHQYGYNNVAYQYQYGNG